MDQQAVLGLAAKALYSHIDGDALGARALVQRISDEYGPEALAGSMVAWAWTALNSAGLGAEQGGIRTIAFRNVDTGEHTAADETAPPVRWGGRFLMAVLSGDDAQLEALMGSVQDERESTLNVITLLSMCSIAITQGIHRFEGSMDELLKENR